MFAHLFDEPSVDKTKDGTKQQVITIGQGSMRWEYKRQVVSYPVSVDKHTSINLFRSAMYTTQTYPSLSCCQRSRWEKFEEYRLQIFPNEYFDIFISGADARGKRNNRKKEKERAETKTETTIQAQKEDENERERENLEM